MISKMISRPILISKLFDRFDLYVGPTLIKKDSLETLEKLKNLDGFDPKITQYD